jgi:hypothetical protein
VVTLVLVVLLALLEIRVLPGPERLARLAFLALVRRVKLARVVAWAVSPVLSLALAALLARPPQADRVGLGWRVRPVRPLQAGLVRVRLARLALRLVLVALLQVRLVGRFPISTGQNLSMRSPSIRPLSCSQAFQAKTTGSLRLPRKKPQCARPKVFSRIRKTRSPERAVAKPS